MGAPGHRRSGRHGKTGGGALAGRRRAGHASRPATRPRSIWRTGCVYNSGEAPANPRPVQQCPPALTMMVGRNDHGRLSSRSDPVRPLHPLPLVDVHRTWIAERIGATDVCVTSDIPLASRCLKKGARVVSPTGKQWTEANIGNALAGRDIARHLRELGEITRGPAPLTKQDRSRFLNALDTAVQAALREASHS